MRGVSASTTALIHFAREILTDDHPQTARQVHYRIFSMGLEGYANDKASYRGLCRILTNARRLWRQYELLPGLKPTEDDYAYAEWLGESVDFVVRCKQVAGLSSKVYKQVLRRGGKIDEVLQPYAGAPPELGVPSNWIVDELRQGERVNVFENTAEYIDAVGGSYRRDCWQSQNCYVELWGEKATVLGSLRPIANKWGLMLRVCRGFGSAAMEDQIGRLFEGIGKPITVFYVGDFDASGVLIEQDMHRRVQVASGVDFQMVRLAIHGEDIARFHLPPQRIKETDSRAAAFRKRFGENAATVELEALPIQELNRRIEQAVSGLIDVDEWNRQLAIQNVELSSIQEFVDTMKNLPQIGRPA